MNTVIIWEWELTIKGINRIGSKSSKTRVKGTKKFQSPLEVNSPIYPGSASLQNHKKEENSYQKNLNQTKHEALNQNQLMKLPCVEKCFDDEFNIGIQPRSNSATVPRIDNSSAQYLRRSLPPLPSHVVNQKNTCDLITVHVEQTDLKTVGDVGTKSIKPSDDTKVLHPNDPQMVDTQLKTSEFGDDVMMKDVGRNIIESHHEVTKASDENYELQKIDEARTQSRNSNFKVEDLFCPSDRKCDTPNGNDATYMRIDSSQTTKDNEPDSEGGKTERASAESDRCAAYGAKANNVTEKIHQNGCVEKESDYKSWKKVNGEETEQYEWCTELKHDKLSLYAGAYMTQNELPWKDNIRRKPKGFVPGQSHNITASSAFLMQNDGNTAMNHLNIPNPGLQISRPLSSNTGLNSQWLSNNNLKHMKIFYLLKSEYNGTATCTVSLRILIGLTEPSGLTKSLEQRIQKHEKNGFRKADIPGVPMWNCNHDSTFVVEVSKVKWIPDVNVVEKEMDSEVFDMYRFMNDSVVDSLFWQQLHLSEELLNEQKMGATISVQLDNHRKIEYRILETLHTKSELPSVENIFSRKSDDSIENKWPVSLQQANILQRDSTASNFELDLHSDGSAPDAKADLEPNNSFECDKIRVKKLVLRYDTQQ